MDAKHLCERLDRLERANRRWKAAAVAGFVVAALVVAITWPAPRAAEAAEEKGKVVICRKLEVQNADGDTVVVINGDKKDGDPGITLMRDDTVFEAVNRKGRKTLSMNVVNGDLKYGGEFDKLK